MAQASGQQTDEAASVPLYVLCGGQSTRFGSDKARAPVGEITLIEAVVASLRPSVKDVKAVADVAGKYDDLQVRTIGDERPGLGPLSGLERALEDAGRGWILVATCDVLGLEPSWVDLLLAGRREGAVAVAFRGERWEPLFALYHVSILPAVRAALDNGELAVWRLLEETGALALPTPPGWETIGIINTPEALADYLR
jgi:molybdenum cofactor guanylyltransferase